jgi:hypothetical protein
MAGKEHPTFGEKLKHYGKVALVLAGLALVGAELW